MSWWGKVLGGTFGYMLGGPLGAVLGAAIGHGFDRGVEGADRYGEGETFEDQERTQLAFFTATFSVMGHIAKADGRVTPDEIRLASDLMEEMRLSADMQGVARRLFTQGKSPDFHLDEVLDQFRRECHRSRNLVRMFLEIQLHAAYADGVVDPGERRVLQHVCAFLGFPGQEFRRLEELVRAGLHFRQSAGTAREAGAMTLEDAYAVLDVSRDTPDEQVKRAYRRLMSQHHPDKLVARGLPEEMMRVATEKTREIKAAYERVKEARGMK